MNIDFDELQGICPHDGSGGCDLQIVNEAVTLMDGGEECDNVECCEKQCPLNSDINKVESASSNTASAAIAKIADGIHPIIQDAENGYTGQVVDKLFKVQRQLRALQ